MEKKSKFQPDKLHFLSFHLLKGVVEGAFDFDPSKSEVYQYDLDYSAEIATESAEVKSNFSVTVKTDSKGNNPLEAEACFSFAFLFKVENLNELISEVAPNQFEVDFPLANAIASISYSTARGILLTRLQGTALREFILPIIDPNILLKGK
ncbi:MAG: hypothetical protein SGI94_12015 [Saprospiraceae bacterium]|nr:hypothetical protein [Saprospiraceae bacterium]